MTFLPFKKYSFFLLIFLIIGSSVFSPAQTAKPNIIFILTDDLGYGDLGVLYQNFRKQQNDPALPSFVTPNLDRIATEGVLLTDHYSGAPVCVSSRASLLTGMTQGNAAIRNNMFDNALENNHNLATVLKESGYTTAAFGKWGLPGREGKTSKKESEESESVELPLRELSGHPLKKGFDYYFGYLTHLAGHFHYPQEDHQKVTENYENLKEDLTLCYTTDLFTARCKKWIADQKKADPAKPFFIYLAYDTPHATLQYPPCEYPKEGVQWTLYQGTWPWLPKMDFLPPFKSGLSNDLSLAQIPLTDNQATMLSGFLQVPEKGEYEFFIQSNGFHLLKIHEALVLDQGGDPSRVTGETAKIVLEKGVHPFRLYYLPRSGKSETPSLNVEWSSATMKKRPITKEDLY